MSGRVLAVAESDSSGGAGIQADIKTILAFGGYASTAVSSVVAQNTNGIVASHIMDSAFVAQQMRVILEDIGTDVIKTGILGNEAIINAVSDVLDEVQHDGYKVLIDPSVVSRTGQSLLDSDTIATLKRRLLVRASVLTPNRWEAELLTGVKIKDLDDMRHATEMMITFGADAVVLKAGQLTGKEVVTLVVSDGIEEVIESPMINTRHTHGAGCTLSAGIAVALAQGSPLLTAVERSLDFLNRAIETAPLYGSGVGPINHAHSVPGDISFKKVV